MADELKLDGHKLLFHLDAVEDWSKGRPFFPLYISFSPVQRCNHRCVFCAYSHREKIAHEFPHERLARLVKEWRGTSVKAVLFSGDGEPLLHSRCAEMAAEIAGGGISVAVNTNGALLTPGTSESLVKSLDWIRISLNAGTGGTYAKVHGVREQEFQRVLTNISELVEARNRAGSRTTVGIQCVLLPENKHEIAGLAREIRSLGADYFSVKPRLGIEAGGTPSHEEYAGLQAQLGALNTDGFRCILRETLQHPPRDYKRCLGHRFVAEMDARGNVSACGPRLGDSRFYFGNVLEHSFEEIWNSENRRRVCDWLEQDFDLERCMEACRCDSINRFLWGLRHPPNHVNFI